MVAGVRSANGGRFEINQLLFADDTPLVADSVEMFCGLVHGVNNIVRSQAEIYRGLDVGYIGASLVLRNYVW